MDTLTTIIVALVVFLILFALLWLARSQTPELGHELKLPYSNEITKHSSYKASVSSVGSAEGMTTAKQNKNTGHYVVKVYEPIATHAKPPKMSGAGLTDKLIIEE